MKKLMMSWLVLAAAVAGAEQVVNIKGAGNKKFSVSVNVANSAYATCLKKNLELSGVFEVRDNGSIKVSGAPGAITAEGSGKRVSSAEAFADDKTARMAARRLSDAMCQAWGNQKGFACDKVLFLNRGKWSSSGSVVPGELCMSYPDGFDIRQLTNDGKMSVYPRWKADGESVVYISDLNGAPQVWELNTATGKRNRKWGFKGTVTSIAPSPDGRLFALTLSLNNNVELYVADPAADRLTRLTTTPLASEGQPTWSPDGKKIAYVSDETRHPQIYVIDVATKEKRRLTSRGLQNVDPDWGKDGRITYITKRGGSQVAVMNPAEGDASAQLVTEVSNWEHPSWARDGRHVVANRDKTLFVIDTLPTPEGKYETARRMFNAKGNWNSPTWVK